MAVFSVRKLAGLTHGREHGDHPLRPYFVWARKKSISSMVFAGQAVGFKEVDDGIWLVSFMDYSRVYRSRGEDSATSKQPLWPKV